MGSSVSIGGVMHAGKDTEAFKHFYPQLIEWLPMDDVVFLSKLFAANLPEDHLKLGDTNKQTHLQESVINQSVTLTELYQLFIVTTLQKQVKDDGKPTYPVDSEVEKILCEMMKGIPNQVMGTVFCLSRLAYHSFFYWYSKRDEYKIPKAAFTIENLIQCGLKATDHFYGLLKLVNTDKLPTDNVTFSFAHFTIQDFMCALYITTLPQEKQKQLLKEHNNNFSNVVVFWSGLVSTKATQFICDWLQDDEYCITAVQCAYESKKTNLMQPTGPLSFNFDHEALSPYECLAISTVLSHHKTDDLCMMESHVGDEGMKMLLTHYRNGNNSGHPFKRLELAFNDFTIVGAKLLAKVVMNSSITLEALDVGGNSIGDEGVSLLIKGLKDNKVLSYLGVDDCQLSIKGIRCIAAFLKKNNHPIEMLSLCSNNIGDKGASVIVDALKDNNKINQLSLSQCGISAKGATYTAGLLRTKYTLDILSLCANNIGDDGAIAIAGHLGHSNIFKLFLDECGITTKGAKALAESLQTNKRISVLCLSDNPITVEGARAIFESLVGNGTLWTNVVVDNHLLEDDEETQLMKEVLQLRSRRWYLKRCREFDDDDDDDDSCTPSQVKKCED